MSTLKCKKLLLFAIFPKEPPSGEEAEQQSVNNARAGAVHDHGAGDREHLCARAGNESFALELERGRYDGVGKARDRHKRTGSGEARDIVVQPQPREQRAEEYERDRNCRSGALRVQPERGIKRAQPLASGADEPADEKRAQHVHAERGARLLLFYIFVVFFVCHVHKNSPPVRVFPREATICVILL